MPLSSPAGWTVLTARSALAALAGAALLVTGFALPGPGGPHPGLTGSTAPTAGAAPARLGLAAAANSAISTLGQDAPTGPSRAPASAASPSLGTIGGATRITTASAQTLAAGPAITAGRPSGSVLPTPGVPGPGTNLFRVAGVPTPTWMPNDAVHALATDGTYVYLGGDFTSLHAPTGPATATYTRLARINLKTGVADPGWTPTVDGSVLSLALNSSGTALYLGGTFTTVDGQARANLAAVSTTGSGPVTSFNPGPNNRVQAILTDGSELVVGGAFTQIAGLKQPRLAKVMIPSGVLDTTFSPTIDGPVESMAAVPGQSAYAVGGNFATIDGTARNDIAIVTSSAGSPTSWNATGACTAPAGCPVLSIVISGAQLFVAQGGPGGRAAAYNLSSGAIQWAIAADGNCQVVAVAGTDVFVGGHFNPQFGTAVRHSLAAVDAATGAIDPSFAPTVGKAYPGTWALLVTPQGLVVGGAQPDFSGTTQSYFALFARSSALPRPPQGTHLTGTSSVRR